MPFRHRKPLIPGRLQRLSKSYTFSPWQDLRLGPFRFELAAGASPAPSREPLSSRLASDGSQFGRLPPIPASAGVQRRHAARKGAASPLSKPINRMALAVSILLILLIWAKPPKIWG